MFFWDFVKIWGAGFEKDLEAAPFLGDAELRVVHLDAVGDLGDAGQKMPEVRVHADEVLLGIWERGSSG